jgi:arylsulfatase A-like enzyme
MVEAISRRGLLKLLGLGAGSLLLPAHEGHTSVGALQARARPLSRPPAIILIIVDALRHDHVSAHGYARSTTPNLDAWIADQGVLFHNATSPSPWTFPANAALMTGRTPYQLGASWTNTSLPANVATLPQYLHAAGYYTAGFVSNSFVSAGRGFGRGFDLYDGSAIHPNSYQGIAGELNTLVFDWLSAWDPAAQTQPLFLFLYYMDPHSWFDPPPPYDTLYDPDYDGPLTPEVFRDGQDVVAGLIVPTERDIEHLLALYDGEISYWDDHLGQLLGTLQGYGLLDEALVAVTSDHGELFGEHGKWIHGNCLYEEVLRVPLLMRYPGFIAPGQAITAPVQNVDLMPTILDWSGIPLPPELRAVSLRPLLEGRTGPATRDLFSEIDAVPDPSHWNYWNRPPEGLYSVQREPWKYIHHVDNVAADELYQLNASSPYETDNLIQSEPVLAEELRQALFEWFRLPRAKGYIPFVCR